MKSAALLLGLLVTVRSISPTHACFATFQEVWAGYFQQELREEYTLYGKFLDDRCQRLSQLWEKAVSIGVIPCNRQDLGSQCSAPHCISKPVITDEAVIFNIGWLDSIQGGNVSDPGTAAYWELAARPLMRRGRIIESGNEEVLRACSLMRPQIVFLHELTHLLLRMEFILEPRSRWTPEDIRNRNSVFESAYSHYIMQRLLHISPRFSIFMVPEADPDCCTCFCVRYTPERATAESLARQCGICWGGVDEVLVIMGVKLILNGKAHVLGETMLLRKLAALHGLSPHFVCWSHQLTFLPNPEDPESTVEPPRESLLCSHLLFQHRDAFMALWRHLGWDDVIAAPADPAAPLPLPVSERPSSERAHQGRMC
ncbi:MAG: hypothetical protein LBT57_02560 [Puniceicoccales bacterium]|jgi:hypothetical protein|nr:hypothetical protein [Puniceicoccales bacterium]